MKHCIWGHKYGLLGYYDTLYDAYHDAKDVVEIMKKMKRSKHFQHFKGFDCQAYKLDRRGWYKPDKSVEWLDRWTIGLLVGR